MHSALVRLLPVLIFVAACGASSRKHSRSYPQPYYQSVLTTGSGGDSPPPPAAAPGVMAEAEAITVAARADADYDADDDGSDHRAEPPPPADGVAQNCTLGASSAATGESKNSRVLKFASPAMMLEGTC